MEKIILGALLHYLVFPGLLFLAAAGMVVSWIDRKLTARLQWRQGPPLLQPFYDIRKLFLKEIIMPAQGNRILFLFSPLIAMTALVIIANIVFRAWYTPAATVPGDLLVVLYLFTVPPLAGMLGASASHSPFASVGAAREMKTLLSYELPFVLAVLVPVIKSNSIAVGGIVLAQHQVPHAASLSGIIATLVAVICMQAKMGLPPFDAPEAETELAGGSLIEYSGPLLAIWKLSRMMLLVLGPVVIAILFLGGGNAAALLAAYVPLLLVAILIKNTNPRLRIDQTVRFFWSWLSIAAAAAAVAATAGW